MSLQGYIRVKNIEEMLSDYQIVIIGQDIVEKCGVQVVFRHALQLLFARLKIFSIHKCVTISVTFSSPAIFITFSKLCDCTTTVQTVRDGDIRVFVYLGILEIAFLCITYLENASLNQVGQIARLIGIRNLPCLVHHFVRKYEFVVPPMPYPGTCMMKEKYLL